MEKAKRREREHEIVYERKLAKERSQEDHLFADKDKFVTSAYKRKLAEQEKWKEEERLRELREERDDVSFPHLFNSSSIIFVACLRFWFKLAWNFAKHKLNMLIRTARNSSHDHRSSYHKILKENSHSSII